MGTSPSTCVLKTHVDCKVPIALLSFFAQIGIDDAAFYVDATKIPEDVKATLVRNAIYTVNYSNTAQEAVILARRSKDGKVREHKERFKPFVKSPHNRAVAAVATQRTIRSFEVIRL